ncbi:MAG TPA: TolC family protein [Candidatus Eisenbacteria bacterium]|nr:TolC family protein [Candidatus Eisenbacteria bacterium]
MGRPLALLACTLTSLLVATPGAFANDTRPLVLADVVAAAREHNPRIATARARTRAADAVPAQASAYDDPVVSWEAWNIPESVDVARADNNIFRLSQKIPFPGKRTLAGEVARHEADAVGADADATELDVVADVKRAYWSLWLRHQRLLVFEREKALLERYARLSEQKYALSEVPQPDVLRAQVELTHAINRVTTEGLALDGARAELNALLSRSPDEPLGTPQDPTFPGVRAPLAALVDVAVTHRPEMAAQAAAIAREQTGVRLAEKGYLPDFEVSVGRFINNGTQSGFGAMASMTIPLAYKSKVDAGVSAANARLATAEAERRRVLDAVRRDVQQALVRVRAARLQRDIFTTTHIPQTEQALRVTESAYQTGGVDFLALIDTVRMIESVHLEHIDAESDLGKAWADLERALGTDVPADALETRPHREGLHHE